MAKNTEKKTTSCTEFYDLHPKIPLWIVLLFKECENLDLTKGETRCVSNIIEKNEARLTLKNGALLCVVK